MSVAGVELPPQIITATPEEVTRAFVAAAEGARLFPTPELIATLLAHSALETGNWRAMCNFNFGNVKATESWIAAGGSFTYYDVTQPGADAPVTETLPLEHARTLLARAKPRTDGGAGLDMEIRSTKGSSAYCLFWPSNPEARFRAFRSLQEGAAAYLSKLTGRYKPALSAASRGDVAGYVATIHGLGYFTADLAGYTRVVEDRYRRYLPTAREYLLGAWTSALEDIVPPSPDDFLELATGAKITTRALRDRRGLMARPPLGKVDEYLAAMGLRVASPEELELFAALAEHIDPVILPTPEMCALAGVPLKEASVAAYRNPRMRSEHWCRLHDEEAERRAGSKRVVNDAKWWTTMRRIIGWWLRGGRKVQPLSSFHATDLLMTDYATGIRAVLLEHRQAWLEGIEELADTLALRCLAWTGYQLGIGIREIPGAQHNAAILEYSRHCRRGGHLLGVDAGGVPLWTGGARLALTTDEDHWCAAAASAGLLNSLLPGETPPHGLRVAVREIAEDARASKRLHVLGDGYTPKPGDLALEGRAGESPLAGGRGHVRRVVLVEGERYEGIGGNEGNTWGRGWYPITGELRADGHRLVAWVEV